MPVSYTHLDVYKRQYVESWTHPKAPQAPPSPRLIIPTSKHSYLARDTRDNLDVYKRQVRADIGDIRNAGDAVALFYQGKGHEEKADYVKLAEPVEELSLIHI